MPARKIFVLLTPLLLLILPASSCTHSNNIRPQPAFSCFDPPQIQPDLPFDVDLPSHENVQCFAWQEFIALNWPADAARAGEPDRGRDAAKWGDPGPPRPTVWETFKEAHEVFLPDAAPPAPWGRRSLMSSFAGKFQLAPPEDMADAAALSSPAAVRDMPQEMGLQVLRMTSKISSRLRLNETEQAFGTGRLIGQNGGVTYYAIYVNEVAFDHILTNGLFDARNHAVTDVRFPAGRTGAGDNPNAAEGAIVLKSAWLDLSGMNSAERRKFHTTRACLVDDANRCRWATVGLVGLHILQKTETFPQWTWATFEHVDNAPDREDLRQENLRARYNYYDPNCPSARVCDPNVPPAPGSSDPTQVVRRTPIPQSSRLLNAQVHEEIRRANRDSVWLNYQLVDVQWPEAGTMIQNGENVPLPLGAPRPSSIANATLETYVQHTTCLECHQRATIAPTTADPGPTKASDYSFLLRLADESPP